MMRWILAMVAMMGCAAAHADAISYECVNPAAEIRAIWLDAGAIPKSQAGIKELVRTYQKANLNLIFPEVIARGYSVYPSKLIARDPRFVGAPDLLSALILEAHAVGIEVHPWVWVFRAGYSKDRGAILGLHPEWAEIGKNGKDLSPNGGYWISPAVPAARDFLARMFEELVRNYDIDGLHLDYIRYEVENKVPYGYSEESRAAFLRQYGIDPLEIEDLSFHRYEWQLFRERQINTFVQRIALQTRAIRPRAKISAAVGSDPTPARLELMQNWVNWVDNKWVDFVAPMAYSTDDDYFTRIVSRQIKSVQCRTLVAPGIGFFEQNEPAQMARQIGIAREQGADGQSLFAGSYFREGQAAALADGPYKYAAGLPFREPWEKCRNLNALSVLFSNMGCSREAEYLSSRAAHISAYASYQAAATGYVPPTPPPISIPEFVVALPSVDVPRTTSAVRIDGVLDDAEWSMSPKISLSYTNEGKSASVATTAYLSYDDMNLYVAFKCEEPLTGKIRASAEKRDGPTFVDDSVELFIAPGKGADYYHLSTNTIETRFDARVKDPSWNGEWRSAAHVGSNEWTAEIAVPFSTLGLSAPTPGSRWTMNLTRNRTTTGVAEYLTWAVPYGSFHTPTRFGCVTFR